MAIKVEHAKQRVDALDADLSGSTFNDVNLAGATFENVNLSSVAIRDANLRGASIAESNTVGMTINGIAIEELLAAYRAARSQEK